MTIRLAVIDHSALEDFPYRYLACARMHQQLDQYWRLRQHLGASMAPPLHRVHSLGDGRVLVSRVEAK